MGKGLWWPLTFLVGHQPRGKGRQAFDTVPAATPQLQGLSRATHARFFLRQLTPGLEARGMDEGPRPTVLSVMALL